MHIILFGLIEKNLNFYFIIARTVECYNCRKTGHISRDCPDSKDEKVCYNCNESGHLKRNCPELAAVGDEDDRECYNCRQKGHLSGQCPERTCH